MKSLARAAFPLLALALIPRAGFADSCSPEPTRLCLGGYRFAVEVAWTIPGGGSGAGQAVPLSEDTGLFWFFGNTNLELVVKVLDGRPVNHHFWVYYGSLSNVEYTITITDLKTGVREMYHNPAGRLASQADTSAFEPEPPAAAQPAKPLAPAPSFPLRLGPELQVNVNTPGLQWEPAVAVGADGGFMVVWLDDSIAVGRVYDAAGRPRSGEIRLSAGAQTGYAQPPLVVALSGGRYAAVWAAGSRVFGQLFALDGERLGGTFPVGKDPQRQASPSIAADPAGGFLVAWVDAGDSSLGIAATSRTQRFGAAGNAVGPEVVLGSVRSGLRVAALPNGGFLAVWTEEDDEFFETNVWAQRLAESGAPAAAAVTATGFPRPTGYHYAPLPLVHPDGGFSVLWETYLFCCDRPGAPGLFARRFSADDQPQGDIDTLRLGAQFFDAGVAATVLPSGETLVLWVDSATEDPDGGVFGQLFDSVWSPRGGRFRLNTYTDREQFTPAAAIGPGGNLVAVWSSGVGKSPIGIPIGNEGQGTQDGDFYGVFSQRFTTATCALSSDQLCLAGRFRVEVQLTDPRTGKPGAGHAVPLTSDSGAFWFFGASNVELMVKMVDGRAVNGAFWFFFGALSDVEYTITVTDSATGRKQTYRNPRGRIASLVDGNAFPAGPGS